MTERERVREEFIRLRKLLRGSDLRHPERPLSPEGPPDRKSVPAPVLVVEWACGECGDRCPTAEEATVHCDASWWEAAETARNRGRRRVRD